MMQEATTSVGSFQTYIYDFLIESSISRRPVNKFSYATFQPIRCALVKARPKVTVLSPKAHSRILNSDARYLCVKTFDDMKVNLIK